MKTDKKMLMTPQWCVNQLAKEGIEVSIDEIKRQLSLKEKLKEKLIKDDTL